MTRIGDMDKKVTFQTGALTGDGMGAGGTTTWSDTLTCWAAIWPLRSGESLENLKTELRVTHKIRCWYDSSISADQRVKYGSRYFQIVSLINPNEDSIELEILAEEVT